MTKGSASSLANFLRRYGYTVEVVTHRSTPALYTKRVSYYYSLVIKESGFTEMMQEIHDKVLPLSDSALASKLDISTEAADWIKFTLKWRERT